MSNIVTDYRKCISIIDSCVTLEQFLNCDNLINAFRRKHEKDETSFKRYKELYKYMTNKNSERKESFTLITS